MLLLPLELFYKNYKPPAYGARLDKSHYLCYNTPYSLTQTGGADSGYFQKNQLHADQAHHKECDKNQQEAG